MELSRSSVIDRIQSKAMSIDEFNYDKLTAPPIYSMFTQEDLDRLYYIATSARFSGNARKRYQEIDKVMKPRGFVKLSAGTNRVCYRHLEDSRFVAKVAADAIGMGDNPAEFRNQFKLKPFCTKIFEVDPTGVLAIVERVNPITSREEYLSVADDVYLLLTEWILGEYIMADIGSKYYMNTGCRAGFGVVLLDFPYLYELDGNKLYCKCVDESSPTGICGGLLDYDDGFNEIRCTKCGTRYRVRELAKQIKEDKIITKGGRTKMKVSCTYGGTKISTAEEQIFAEPTAKVEKKEEVKPATGLKVSANYVTPKKPVIKHNNNRNKNDLRRAEKPSKLGIVKSNGGSGIKASSGYGNGAKRVLNGVFSSIDLENKIMIFKDGDDSIIIKLEDIPEEYNDLIVENKTEELDEELKSACDAISNFEDEVFDLKKTLGEVKEANDSLTEDNKIKEKEIITLRAEVESLKESGSSNEDASKALAEKDAKIAELEAKINELNDDVDSLSKKVDEKEEQINLLNVASSEIIKLDNNYDKDIAEGIYSYYTNYSNIIPATGSVVDVCDTFGSKLADGVEEAYRKALVLHSTDGSYMSDENGTPVVICTINGKAIDDLFEVVGDDNDYIVDEESEDEEELVVIPVGVVQQ